jgi:hypothetical protein
VWAFGELDNKFDLIKYSCFILFYTVFYSDSFYVFSQILSIVPLPFYFSFPQLRRLNLTWIWNMRAMDRRMYNVFVCLLRSMPLLEELEVMFIFLSFSCFLISNTFCF